MPESNAKTEQRMIIALFLRFFLFRISLRLTLLADVADKLLTTVSTAFFTFVEFIAVAFGET